MAECAPPQVMSNTVSTPADIRSLVAKQNLFILQGRYSDIEKSIWCTLDLDTL